MGDLRLRNQQNPRSSKITVVLADGTPLMMLGKKTCLESQRDIEVIAETGDGKQSVELALMLKPDVVILDEELRTVNGLDAARQIIANCPDTDVLVMTSNESPEHILEIYRSGASSYLPNLTPVDIFIRDIRKVYFGENSFPEDIIHLAAESILDIKSHANPGRPTEISQKEIRILEYVVTGMSNKQIAKNLDVSVQYIKECLSIIYLKLGASSRVEAIVFALKNGLISI